MESPPLSLLGVPLTPTPTTLLYPPPNTYLPTTIMVGILVVLVVLEPPAKLLQRILRLDL